MFSLNYKYQEMQTAPIHSGRHLRQTEIDTHSILSKLLREQVIFSLRVGLDGLLLHTHGEQGLEAHRKITLVGMQ